MSTSLTSIQTSGDDIQIVNQLLLPHVVEFLPINTIEEAHDAIKTMKVRHFPSICICSVCLGSSCLFGLLRFEERLQLPHWLLSHSPPTSLLLSRNLQHQTSFPHPTLSNPTYSHCSTTYTPRDRPRSTWAQRRDGFRGPSRAACWQGRMRARLRRSS